MRENVTYVIFSLIGSELVKICNVSFHLLKPCWCNLRLDTKCLNDYQQFVCCFGCWCFECFEWTKQGNFGLKQLHYWPPYEYVKILLMKHFSWLCTMSWLRFNLCTNACFGVKVTIICWYKYVLISCHVVDCLHQCNDMLKMNLY